MLGRSSSCFGFGLGLRLALHGKFSLRRFLHNRCAPSSCPPLPCSPAGSSSESAVTSSKRDDMSGFLAAAGRVRVGLEWKMTHLEPARQ